MPDVEIVYEDEQLAVLSKPAGLVVHAGAGNTTNTLMDWLRERWPVLRDDTVPRGGLVHRLDKDTSGLLLVAKTATAHTALAKLFADRTLDKRYQALVQGHPQPPQGRIDAPITRHHADRTKMTVRPDGRAATTDYRTIQTYANHTLLELTLLTGRTHQLRVHLAALGHPIVGDPTYGTADPTLHRQFLHATYLQFQHPTTGRLLSVEDPLAPELQQFLATVDT